jgi:bifunctional NMN adenylyltransferase/nudix hydrolase
MMLSLPNADVGVVVGRFQIHELHEAHLELLEAVRQRYDRMIVLLGVSQVKGSLRNPLTFPVRESLIKDHFPSAECYPLYDCRTDIVWSATLDKLLQTLLLPHQTVVLLGGRDSFVPYYHGRFPTCALQSDRQVSASSIRRRIANQYAHSVDFRAGLIAASFNQFPTNYMAVDTAVVDFDARTILLGRKLTDGALYRFPGGFTTPESASLEEDACREVREETGVECCILAYLESRRISDWRYRGEIDQIMSAFFLASYISGQSAAGDDLDDVVWAPLAESWRDQLVPEHQPFAATLTATLELAAYRKGKLQ